jgi:hypothetical protein
MQVRIQVVVVGEDDGQTVQDIVTIERTALSPETLGLSLADGKAILSVILGSPMGETKGRVR